MKDLTLLVPLFNEEESLEPLEEWIRKVVEEEKLSYEILFVDDGSSDRSWEIIEKLKTNNPNIRAIKFRRNYGKSAALNTGFEACEGKVVITMDADLQDSPDEIPALYSMIVDDGYDIVSGWKKKRFDSVIKNTTSKVYNWAARKMTGIHLNDMNCGLKSYRSEVVKSVEIFGEMHRYIPVIAKWAGFTKIGEKAVQHRARQYGTTKFGVERFINGFLDLLTITFLGKFGKRPMHFLGTIGTLCFIAGFISLLYLSILKLWFGVSQITDRPLFFFGILTLIVGTQLFIGGFIAELISRNAADRNFYLIEKEL